MIEANDRCCGCAACQYVCPTKAITMKEDNKGFMYPSVNLSLCVNCGKCEQICTINNKDMHDSINYYGLRIKNNEDLSSSTSGGAFTAISNYVLKNNGCIVSASFDGINEPMFVSIDSKSERNKSRACAYFQINMTNTYEIIKNNLKNHSLVMFIGLPCQVSAVKNTFHKYLDKILLVDLMCHGVPSYSFFRDHLETLKDKFKVNIEKYTFRDKKYGWESGTSSILYYKNKKKYKKSTSEYMTIFNKDLNLRDSCYNCRFSTKQRVSDITIGDFWGIEKSIEIYDNKGVSAVIVNTSKGQKIFDNIEDADIYETTYKNMEQRAISYSINKPHLCDQFWCDYFEHGFYYVSQKYCKRNLRHSIKKFFYRILHIMKLDAVKNRIKVKIKSK